MRALVEPMERFFDAPWAALSPSRIGIAEADIQETPTEIVVSMPLPDFSRDDIKVDVTETTLTIRARRSAEREQRRRHGVLRQEQRREFVQHLTLPAPVKTGEVAATFKDDRLEVRLPRVKETQVRRVDIS